MIKYITKHLNIKIFIITTFLLIGTGMSTYRFITITMPPSYTYEIDSSLDRTMQNLIVQLKQMDFSEIKHYLKFLSDTEGIIMQLYDKDGNEIYFGANVSFSWDPSYNAYERQESISTTHDYTFVPKNSEASYTIRVLSNRQRVDLYVQALRQILPQLVGLITIIAVIISWLYSRYLTNPVIKLSNMSKELAGLNFDTCYQIKREDEIGILADNLNALSRQLSAALNELQAANDSLQQEIEQEKKLEMQQLSFFSAVSHELKTPITVLKGQLQGMIFGVGGYKNREKYLPRAFEVVCSMEGLVLEILSVTKMRSSGFSINLLPVYPAEIIKSVILEYEELAMQKNISIVMELEDTPKIHADTGLFRKAVSNILSNAFRYSPEDNTVRIKLFAGYNEVILRIENSGTSIPKEEIPQLFQAFKRGEESRNRETGGSGLGLYIIKMILDLHHFTYTMINIPDGIRFEVHCPNY